MLKRKLSSALKRLGAFLIAKADKLKHDRPELVEPGISRSLYRLKEGFDLWLNNTGYIDKQIIEYGVFEPTTTRAIHHFVRTGDVVIDVGANIGYYTAMISRLVGPTGKVIAFEPTQHFGKVLRKNIETNKLKNIEVIDCGLSNKDQSLIIDIGPSSATLHSPSGFDVIHDHETITLTTLDNFIKLNNFEKIDFIKIDVDGHEPLFFEGAWNALESYSPIVILEISHLHYLEAGVTAWDFYDLVSSKGYRFFYEDNYMEIDSKESFLRRCANFAYSSNVLIAKHSIK